MMKTIHFSREIVSFVHRGRRDRHRTMFAQTLMVNVKEKKKKILMIHIRWIIAKSLEDTNEVIL